jgi:hypothetical protein
MDKFLASLVFSLSFLLFSVVLTLKYGIRRDAKLMFLPSMICFLKVGGIAGADPGRSDPVKKKSTLFFLSTTCKAVKKFFPTSQNPNGRDYSYCY